MNGSKHGGTGPGPCRSDRAETVDRDRGRRGVRLRWARIVAMAALVVFAAIPVACEPEDHGGNSWRPDTRAPAEPRGLWSMTGDREVRLMWMANTEDDLEGYRIYRSTEPTGYFPRIATVGHRATSYTDREVHNGVTYYYTISAFDFAGNESDLSADTIHDTPRPEGEGLQLANAGLDPHGAGYDFSADRVVSAEDVDADIYYWQSTEKGAWMIATDRSTEVYTDIQDAGYMRLEDVDWAPEQGWAPSGEVPLVEGHSYIVWTWDNHFAKFRVASVNPERVVIDWAYQVDEGNPELLRPGSAVAPRPPLAKARAHEHGLSGRIAS